MERFVLQKEEELKNMDISDNKLLEYKGKTKTSSDRLNIEIRITADSIDDADVNDELKKKLKEIKQRIKRVREYIESWKRSEMIKELTKAHVPFIKPPIKKTNIILKNQNFKIAAKLWEYLQRYDLDDRDTSRDNVNSDGNDVIKGFLDHSFLLNYYVLDSVSTSKREQKRQLSKYAVVMLTEEVKRIVDLLLSCGLKVSEEDIMKLVAQELKYDKGNRLVGQEDVKKKFKSAMDEYLERTQGYL